MGSRNWFVIHESQTLNSNSGLKMSYKIKDINIKNHIYYFSDDVINIKNFDPNNIKID